jgi:putative ABC transport system permease protein
MKNVFRNKFRTAMTVTGVAVAILAFMALRTVISAWSIAAEYAVKDRLATRNKISFVVEMPKKYVADIAEIPGVTGVSWANWFGGKDPNDERGFFATIALDPKTALEVYDEIVLPDDQKARFIDPANRQCAIVGDVLAKNKKWTVGQKITLTGTIFPRKGDWPMEICGIYTTSRKSLDRATLYFNWEYLNQSRPEDDREKVGWIAVRVDDESQASAVSDAIDKKFRGTHTETLTQSERAMNLSFLSMFSAILRAIDISSVVILLIMMLILGNTIAMGVRERTNEYGVLRAIGFLPRHVAQFIVVEALFVGAIGGAAGILLSMAVVNGGMAKWLEENMQGMFPAFYIDSVTYLAAAVLALALAGVASALPAWRASKLSVVDALRRVG